MKPSVGIKFLFIVVFLFSVASTAQDTFFAGFATVNCPAEILPGGSGKPVMLRPGEKDYPLATGDKLRCVGEGDLIIDVGDHKQTLTQRDSWVSVPRSSNLDALHDSTDPAVTRGGVPVIYSPPPRGAARPEHLVIRWNAWPQIGDVSLIVNPVSSPEQLCCKVRVPGSTGTFDSPALQNALVTYRAAHPDSNRFKIEISDSKDNRYSSNFRLLSEADELQLDQKLANWDRRDPITRRLGRAYSFKSFGLFSEAAEEYEAALKLAPTSPYLLRLTVAAEHRTGNDCRVRVLKQREQGQSQGGTAQTTETGQCTLEHAP